MNSKLNHIQNWTELAEQVNASASDLAGHCGVSVRTLERYFRKQMGSSPKAWLAEQRQRRAVELLRAGASVKETARSLHYKHPSHLTNEFKKHWGHSPTAKTPS
jgi:AraC-like DNA-binding protein